MKQRTKTVTAGVLVASITIAGVALANPLRDAIINGFAAEAGVSSFSAEAGREMFLANIAGGKPETPSCTSCHTDDLTQAGKTRVGKLIEPMAVSVNPERFTDAETVAKWFRRNCKSVVGRECTPLEKGNFLAYFLSL